METAVRRIADEQIGKALASMEALDQPEAIHDVRKRCKKLRGLIRLVRPAFDAYSRENAVFRDAARAVSGARDSKVMQDTYDLLMSEFEGQVDRQEMGSIRRRFTLERKTRVEDGEFARKLEETRECLREARERACSWEIGKDGWNALEGGLKKTYGRARDAAAEVRSCADDKAFHQLRKRVKYHWYHCRLLEGLWPEMMSMRQHAAKRASDILGDHHDLAVFAGQLSAEPETFGDPREVEVAIGLARARQERLEKEVWPILDRLLAQSPDALAEHLEALGNAWRKDG